MEIWIIGGLIVVAMVLISTKIKKTAAKAYEPETVETEEFLVRKPEGFLHPVRRRTEYPFEVYSKLYGADREARNIWRASAVLRVHDGKAIDRILTDAIKEETFTAKDISQTDLGRECVSRSEKTEDEMEYAVLRRIVENRRLGKTWELQVTMLRKHEPEYAQRAAEMLASMDIKGA